MWVYLKSNNYLAKFVERHSLWQFWVTDLIDIWMVKYAKSDVLTLFRGRVNTSLVYVQFIPINAKN